MRRVSGVEMPVSGCAAGCVLRKILGAIIFSVGVFALPLCFVETDGCRQSERHNMYGPEYSGLK